jgi:hypothetical protein
MQSVLALGLLMSLCVSATAAPVHRSKRPHMVTYVRSSALPSPTATPFPVGRSARPVLKIPQYPAST